MFMNLFIQDAVASSTASTPSTAQGILSMLPMIAILVLFMYFMVIRPQSKRAKDQKKLLDSLQKGDEVMTIGGILGKIEKMADDFIVLNIAENTNITVQKSSIVNVVPRGTIKSV
ncbi:Sec translocon accessory complex subunit YajC [Gammaproteobacteria bacterium]